MHVYISKLFRFPFILLGHFLLGFTPATAQDSDVWGTSWSRSFGVELESTSRSSGASAWNPEDHPSVFIATDGLGFRGLMGGTSIQSKQPGIVIIDADTHEIVTSVHYNVLSWGWEDAYEPHGLGASPDGAWIYLPTGERRADRTIIGRLLIINAKTLKVDKVLSMPGKPHLIKAFDDASGNARILIEGFNSDKLPSFVLDPNDDNRVVGGWNHDQIGDIRSSVNFVDFDGGSVLVVGRAPRSSENAGTYAVGIDTETWQPAFRIRLPDITPLWVTFSADNKYAYMNDSRGNAVVQYDRATNEIVALAPSGIEKPYGAHFDWQDRYLFSVGEDPTSQTRGRAIGVIDTRLLGASSDAGQASYPVVCNRANHATLHPNPDVNELWITCDATGEILVFDMAARSVTARIALPDGGSIHPGSFVNYLGWDGEVVSDLNGLRGSALLLKRQRLAPN